MSASKIGTKKQRDSNLELFRIIIMLLIVAHHYVVNSGLTAAGSPLTENPPALRSIALYLFGAWGKTGINCFVLISGYFMCRSNISLTKFCKLLFEIMFYRLSIYTVFWATGYTAFSWGSLAKLLIPITSIGKGFNSAYLLFFLAIPFLNILVRNLTQKQHVYALCLLMFLYTVLGTFKTVFTVTMNYVSWFVVLYFIASYIRLYPHKIFERTKVWAVLTVIFVSLSAVSVVFYAWYNKIVPSYPYMAVTDSNTFLSVATAVCAFLFFKNVKIRYNPFINTVAACSFGVLLIHAHSDTMRQWLWKDVLNNVDAYSKPWMPLHAIGSVVLIYVVCTVIDCLRIHFLEKPFFTWFNKRCDAITERYKRFETKVFNKFHID